ncbi:MAG TPA: hypothetical protein ENN22_00390 [bacterium]|nr:hypothetical protein [bacterium]
MSKDTVFENRIEALNRSVVKIEAAEKPVSGWEAVTQRLLNQILELIRISPKKQCIIGLDGYSGIDWQTMLAQLKNSFQKGQFSISCINCESYYKSEKELEDQFRPYLGDDPVFGRLYKKSIRSLFKQDSLKALKKELQRRKTEQKANSPRLVIFYGAGTAISDLQSYFDILVYFDLTRQEVLRRNKVWTKLAGKTQSISPKKLYYIDFQIHDRHRSRMLNKIDFYVDGNREEKPVLISRQLLIKATTGVATSPFRLKPIYEPGPWGGQWLKKVRDLPDNWVNCAWSYEVIAQEQSLWIDVAGTILEIPWNTFFNLHYDRIMGSVPKKRFGGEFPIRYDYLDTMGGGDLSVQVHPTTAYIKSQFNEHYHQGEMYYIVAARSGSRVNLGLRAETRAADFFRAAKLADEKSIPFNYHDYVFSVPSKKHDLLQIPPGTVHGSGEGQVVLEISATTYRYTFKLYDHLRPDLNGVMRPVHLGHGFNVIKWFRKDSWVKKNLKQQPRLVREGNGWSEYLIGDRREFFHLVFRMEFVSQIEDDTAGKFHILTLVQGECAKVVAADDPSKRYEFRYSETIIIPACLGKYKILNMGTTRCKIAKARLR